LWNTIAKNFEWGPKQLREFYKDWLLPYELFLLENSKKTGLDPLIRSDSPFVPPKSYTRFANEESHSRIRQEIASSATSNAGQSSDDTAADNSSNSNAQTESDSDENLSRRKSTRISEMKSKNKRTLRNAEPKSKCSVCEELIPHKLSLKCYDCDMEIHKACADPPITSEIAVWYCVNCIANTGANFGFEEGEVTNFHKFQKYAYKTKKDHFGRINVTEEECEEEFWKLCTSPETQKVVEYGADLSAAEHGSGFSTKETDPDDPYSSSPWNLNNFCKSFLIQPICRVLY
jgi:hypothetical protein